MDRPDNENLQEVDQLIESIKKQSHKKMSAKNASFFLDIPLESKKNDNNKNEVLPILHTGNVYLPKNLFNIPIFSVNKKRVIQKNVSLGIDKKTGTEYFITTTESLNQFDFDVLLIIMSMFQGLDPEDELRISAFSISKKLGKNFGGSTALRIRKSIIFLNNVKITIKNGSDEYITAFFGSSINFTHLPSGNKLIKIKLSPFIHESIKNSSNTNFISMSQRISMQSSIQKWLHSYVMSRYPKPFAVNIDTAIKLSNYSGRRPKFINEIKIGLKVLSDLNICNGFVDSNLKINFK